MSIRNPLLACLLLTSPAVLAAAEGRPAASRYDGALASEMLVVTGAEGARGVREAVTLFKASKVLVLTWGSDPVTAFISPHEDLTLVGDVASTGEAARAIIRVVATLGGDDRPLTLRFPFDAVHLGETTVQKILAEDPAAAKAALARWLPREGEIPSSRKISIQVIQPGAAPQNYALGSGEPAVKVRWIVTSLGGLLIEPPQVQPAKPSALAAAKLGARMGAPLGSDKAAFMGFGRGDEDSEDSQATVLQQNGGAYVNATARFRTGQNGDTPGAGRVNITHDATYGLTHNQVDAEWMGKNHGFSGRVIMNDNGALSRKMARAAYVNRVRMGKFTNEATGKIGMLRSTVKIGNASMEDPSQTLYGVGDVVSYATKFRNKATLAAEFGGEGVYSKTYDKTELDHTKLHGGAEIMAPVNKKLDLRAQYKQRSYAFNQDRYFFADKFDSKSLLAGAFWQAAEKVQIGVLGGIQIDRGSQADDVQKKGGLVIAGPARAAFTALMSRGQVMNQTTFALSKKVAEQVKLEAFYNMDRSVDGAYKNNYVGLAVRHGFGADKDSALPDDRRYRPNRGDLYSQRYYKDRGLSQDAFAGQTDSLRKANEWAGSNLHYIEGSENDFARYPKETYNGRAGDCDEQAWLVSKSLNDNARFAKAGGKAYLLDYWSGYSGHGVSLVEEGGKTYVNEYGRTFRVNVDPRASLQEKARAALRQVGPYLALAPRKGSQVDFGVWGTDATKVADGSYDPAYFTDENMKSEWATIDGYTSDSTHAPVETGIAALIGLDGF